MQKILFLLTFIFLSFIFQCTAFASSNFVTDYYVTYNIQPNGLTQAIFDITLTNANSQYYASSYGIQLGFKDVQNISASDEEGIIQPVVTKNENGQNINLAFNEKVVGIGNKLKFRMSFTTSDVVQKNGKIWQIDIPGLSNQEDFKFFDVNINVPGFLKNPVFIKPNVVELDSNN